MSVNLVSHPLVATKLSELRDQRTSSSRFRGLVKEISSLLAIEASRDLQLRDVPDVSPHLYRGIRDVRAREQSTSASCRLQGAPASPRVPVPAWFSRSLLELTISFDPRS